MRKFWPVPVFVGAVFLLFSYPPFNQAWFAWVALVPFLAMARRQRPWPLGFLAGLFFFGLGLLWVTRLSVLGWLVLAGYLSLYPASLLSLSRIFPARFFGLKFACAGVALEYLAGTLLSGFPWFNLGLTQYRNGIVLSLAPLGGVWLVSGLVYLVNGTLFSVFFLRARRDIIPLLLVTFLLFLPPRLAVRDRPALSPAGSISVALVQADVPSSLRAQGPVLEPYLSLTARMESRPDLVVWPETTFSAWDARLPDEVAELTRREGFYLLAGVLEGIIDDDGVERWYNSAVLYAPSGEILSIYRKRHLVPFGEFIPGRRFRVVRRLVERDAGFLPFISPGTDPTGMNLGEFTFLPLVCYESVFPQLVARSFFEVRGYRAAPVAVVLTNDSWLGRLGGGQHFAASTLRAAENGAWLFRVANTGVTAVIDGRGRIVKRIPANRPGILEYDMPLSPPGAGTTPFQRNPRAFPLTVFGLALAFTAGAAVARARGSGKRAIPGSDYFRR